VEGEWIECRDCGLFQPVAGPADTDRRACRRCRRSFGRERRAFEIALPLATTALILFALAQSFPLFGIEIQGQSRTAEIVSGAFSLFERGLSPLAGLVLVVGIVAPLLRIMATLYVLTSLHIGRNAVHLAPLFRLSERMRPWAMLDVLLLGTLIAFTKLHDFATIDIGTGLWALGALVLVLAILDSSFDRRAVWGALHAAPPMAIAPAPNTAIACDDCGFIHPAAKLGEACERCFARLFRRKPESLGRCWALVLSGLLLYVPANAYPALTVISFGRGAPSTILGGVLELLNGEDWPLALLIFTASVAIPVLKLIGLLWLLLSVQLRQHGRLLDRTRLYRIIEFIGRWSMIDVFVAALLTALVALGQVATIEPGLGVLAFGGVVVTTMIAAESFDPRLIWDAAGGNDA
jgi:paraquat-inducible protein A